MPSEASVVALGDPYFVTALRAAGVDGKVTLNANEAEKALDLLIKEGKCKVIIVPDRLANLLERKRDELIRHGYYYPVFAIVPSMEGTMGGARTERLYQIISQAVGARLKLGEG